MIHSRRDYTNVHDVEAAWQEWSDWDNAAIDHRFTIHAVYYETEAAAALARYANIEFENRTPRRQKFLDETGKGGMIQ
jgi:hypothetical protein